MKVLYTAHAVSTGAGREGHTRTDDGRVDLDLALPLEMGGTGEGANPEQLFAAGYAACFHSALQLVARQAGEQLAGTSVGASVGIGPNDSGGFALQVTLEVAIPGLPHERAVELVEKTHQVCPYSNAVRGNIDVDLKVTTN
jgi:lipoyl-dependent peroxiredoxin